MVSNVTSLSNHGLRDWLIQRVSAVVIAAYTIFMMAFFVMHPGLTFSAWQSLFACQVFKVATVLTLLAVVWHAWIGLWTISTDYLKCLVIRLSFQVIVFVALLAFFVWGIAILWSV